MLSAVILRIRHCMIAFQFELFFVLSFPRPFFEGRGVGRRKTRFTHTNMLIYRSCCTEKLIKYRHALHTRAHTHARAHTLKHSIQTHAHNTHTQHAHMCRCTYNTHTHPAYFLPINFTGNNIKKKILLSIRIQSITIQNCK